MNGVAVWHGTDHDLVKLRLAVGRHCVCDEKQPTCPAHTMLGDQVIMDHFAFIATCRQRLIDAEFIVPCFRQDGTNG